MLVESFLQNCVLERQYRHLCCNHYDSLGCRPDTNG